MSDKRLPEVFVREWKDPKRPRDEGKLFGLSADDIHADDLRPALRYALSEIGKMRDLMAKKSRKAGGPGVGVFA